MVKTLGRYEINQEIGRGGMAVVYLAYDPRFKRQVALKVLHKQTMLDLQFKARFRREAEVIASLEHAAIVPVYDYGEEDGQPYLVMRYMPGGSLRDRLHKGKLSLNESLDVLERISSALDKAHGRGIVHRDLKPENILFDEEGWPFVSDFGIAKLAESTTNLTGAGILGTPAYMSPEQTTEKNTLDGRSDQYALAVVLYEMISGRTLFKAKTPVALLVAHASEPPPPLSSVLKGASFNLDAALARALSKAPAERFKSTREFVKAMRQAAGLVKQVAQTKQPLTRAKTTRPAEKPVIRRAGTTRLLEKQSPIHGANPALRAHLSLKYLLFAGLAVGVLSTLWRTLQMESASDPTPEAQPATSAAADSPVSQPTQTIAGISTPRPELFTGVIFIRTLDEILDGKVMALSFSSDGQILAAGGERSGVIHIWEVAQGQLVRSFPSLESDSSLAWISSVSFSQDSSLLSSVGGRNDFTVRIWDLSTGSLARELLGHSTIVTSVAFSPTNDLIASTSWDSRVRVWNAASGETVHTLSGHPDQAYTVAFSPDGRLMASGARGDTVRIWRVEDGQLLQTQDVSLESVRAVVFSADGSLLVAATSDEVLIWQIATGELINSFFLSYATKVAISPDNMLIAATTQYGRASLWSVTGEVLQHLEAPSFDGRIYSLAFSPDGQLLATGGWKQVHLWQINYDEE